MTTKIENSDPLFDVEGAAAYLGVNERWIRRSVEEKRFKFAHLGRKLHFRRSWLDAYVEERSVEPEPATAQDAKARRGR